MTDDMEQMRITPHLNQITKDLRAMASTLVMHSQKIAERAEYVRGQGGPTRDAIAELREALDRLRTALDMLDQKF
jgi:hypothetical protein